MSCKTVGHTWIDVATLGLGGQEQLDTHSNQIFSAGLMRGVCACTFLCRADHCRIAVVKSPCPTSLLELYLGSCNTGQQGDVSES
jgi:hypothetical protein